MTFIFNNTSVEDLKKIKLTLKSIWDGATINDVYYKKLKVNLDGRGDLTEIWSQPWSEKESVQKEVKHIYYTTTDVGVIKGWHIHQEANTQYTCLTGKMQIVLVDVRTDSSTYGVVNQFVIGSLNPSLIKVPAGVLKGWKSLAPNSVIINLLNSADTTDNYKYPWDTLLTDIWEPKNG